jgi:glycosyltransferase involved in cell wall biosynthesis
MKILFINYECPPLGGGGGVASFHLAQELAKRHEVDYLTSGFKKLQKFENINGVHVYRVPVLNRIELSTATFSSMLSFVPSSFLKGISLCREKNYDCIHAQFVVPSGLCGWGLSKIFKTPLLITALGGDVYDPSKKHSPHKSKIMRYLISWLFNHSDMNTVESTNLKEMIEQYYSLIKPILVVPLGFVKPEFLEKKRLELKISEQKLILISVGRLVKRKGYEYAIQALSTLSGNNFHYLIIGDGPEEKNLKNLVSSLGMDEKITFLGYLSEEQKYQYLNISDIYLLPSTHEGFGICLLEAMHCGLPIVSTDNGGQTDFLKDGENALFAPPQNSVVLAEKIRNLMEDEDLRKFVSTNNFRDVRQYYIEEISKNYEHLYSELIKNNPIEAVHENQ